MMLSKMHYAIELSRMGNKVYFINPPREDISTLVKKAETISDVQLLYMKPMKNALFLRHKILPLYNLLMHRYAKKIRELTGGNIDELWNFNPNSFSDVTSFGAKKNILLIYDFYKGKHVAHAVKAADIVLAPSSLIIDYYKPFNKAAYFLQHGLSAAFVEESNKRLLSLSTVNKNKTLKVGYTGNLLRQAMNTLVLEKIIASHPEIEFHIWGPYSHSDNNVSDANENISKQMQQFISFLKNSSNVFLHGVTAQDELAKAMQEMDAFLFVYSATTDMNAASNSHKLLEYISTGKVVISSFVSTYKNTGLLEMCADENSFPSFFSDIVNNIELHNSIAKQRERITYAIENSYTSQIAKIQQLLYSA